MRPTLQIFWTEIHAIPPLSDPFFCRPKTPIPPIKYTQPTACPWLKVPYRRWVPAWATCWIATKKLRRPPGSRMTKTTKKKPTIQGQTGKDDDDENEWTLCEFEYWNAFVSKKKHVSWFWICGWTSDKSFASPKPEKHLFVFFYIQVYLTSVRILVFGSLLIYFMFLVWESFFNGVVLPAERFFFRIRWVGFMGFVPRYWGTQEAAQLSLGAQGQHPRLRTSFLV